MLKIGKEFGREMIWSARFEQQLRGIDQRCPRTQILTQWYLFFSSTWMRIYAKRNYPG